MAGLKTASGEAIDGSFELQVEVEEGDAMGQAGPTAEPPGPTAEPPGPTATTRTLSLRVTGDLHVGGLMLLIAETMGARRDWSAHALWWPARRQWLLRAGRRLEALGVGGGARLRFLPRHRPLRVRLPHGRALRLRLDFASGPARAVRRLCGILGIRHPEELSLLWPDEEEEEEGGGGAGGGRKARGPPPPPDIDLTHLPPPAGEEEPPPPPLPPGTRRLLMTPRGGKGPLAPPRPPRGNPLLRRARLHARWLDSSRSLLEQDVGDEDELLLRVKYHCGLPPDPQDEGLRLALLYEDARRALLREEIDCTQEELLLFAALQYRIDEVGCSEEPGGAGGGDAVEDVGTALSNLELQLGGGAQPPAALEELSPELELAEELEVYRPRRLPLGGGFRPARALLKGTTLSISRGPPGGGGEPPQQLNLRGCGVTPDVAAGGQKFGIKLLVAAPEGMSEIQLRCRDAPQFARWVAGCRLAAQGGAGGGAALGAEARGVLGVLGLPPGGAPTPAPPRAPPDPRRLLPPRLQRKGKQLVPRIVEALHRLGALSAAGARLCFLEAWRALPGCGLGYFVVRFQGGRRDEVLAVGPSRLLRMDAASGAVTRVWRLSGLRQWNVNWESQQVTLELAGEVTLGLRVLSAPGRALHEFLGGYLCLGGRRPGQPLDERLLQQLTGGPDSP